MVAVRYFVGDVDRSLAFYEALGFSLVERWGPPMAILEKDGVQLWLSGPGTSAAKPTPDGRKPEPGGWNRLVVELDELDHAYELLKSTGTVFRNEPIKGPGGIQVLAEDPDGNPIELFQPNI
jgi:catechol 2,3-dioxygenase-like lactoylglutathione lyase family enzyme